jgi:phage terminase small subunit
MKKPAPTDPPKTLSIEARALWERTMKAYPSLAADAMGSTTLRIALEAFDDYNDARARLKREGPVHRDKNHQLRPSPLTRIRDNAREAFYRGFKALRLEPPELS